MWFTNLNFEKFITCTLAGLVVAATAEYPDLDKEHAVLEVAPAVEVRAKKARGSLTTLHYKPAKPCTLWCAAP